MELCTARSISNLPHCSLFTASHIRSKQFQCQSCFSKVSPSILNLSGSRYYSNSALRSSLSDETSRGASPFVKDEADRVVTIEDNRPVEKKDYGENVQNIEAEEDSPEENQIQSFEFLEKFNIKFDSDDTYSILLWGVGAFVTLYLATAIVGAIDSIPLFPKLMEVVGLSYTLWFSTRYLLFKDNREELAAKIDEIRQQVLGSNDD